MAVTRSCPTGKSQFHSHAEAKHALTRIRQGEEDTATVPARAYLCEHCHRWHLTSQATPRRYKVVEPRSRRADWRPPAPELPEPTVSDDHWTWRTSA